MVQTRIMFSFMYPLIKQQKIGNDHNFILFAHFSIARKKEMVQYDNPGYRKKTLE
jgi:hypothetical protein